MLAFTNPPGGGSARAALLSGELEREFVDLRSRPADMESVVSAALRQVCREPVPVRFAEAGKRIAAAVDAAAEGRDELAYHNRHHFAEAVLGMGWLGAAGRDAGALGAENAALGVLAMAGHDLGHDGTMPDGGVLEAEAAEAVAASVEGTGLSVHDLAVIGAVIRGTDPFIVAENAARAMESLPAGPLGHEVDVLIAAANEADVLASLFPALGWTLTGALTRERQGCGSGDGADLESFSARLRFLRTYAEPSVAGRALGIDVLIGRQIAAFRRFGATPEGGAAALDGLPRAAAAARFAKALKTANA